MTKADWKRLLFPDPEGDKGHIVLRAVRVGLGCFFLVLGILGLFLPFLQGILFILIGLTLLSSESRRAHRWMHHVRERFERARHKPSDRPD